MRQLSDDDKPLQKVKMKINKKKRSKKLQSDKMLSAAENLEMERIKYRGKHPSSKVDYDSD